MPTNAHAPPGAAIDLTHVSKTYRGGVRALCDVSMRVQRGEIFGLLGPNGAGKSTLVKIMMTVIRASKASGTILGRPVGHKKTLAHVGYLPEHHMLPKYLTGRQMIDFYGTLAGVTRADRRRRINELLELVRMEKWGDRRIGTYSKGMMQRVGLAQALVNDPDLVVLDEPTDGVDPVGRREIREVLVTIRDAGKTVFLNSHLLSELEMVCTRVAIMVQGQVRAHGTIDDLTRESQRYEIEIEGPPPDGLSGEDVKVQPVGENGRTVITQVGQNAERIQPLIDALRREGCTITAIRPVRESLEDLFMRAVRDPATGGSLQPGAARSSRRPAAAQGGIHE